MSIKKKLPLFTAILLGAVMVASTWAAYRAVRESALEVGRERLRHLTQQLSGMLQQSANVASTRTFTAANENAIRTLLQSPATSTSPEVEKVLLQFGQPQDPSGLRVEIWNADKALLSVFPKNNTAPLGDLQTEFKECAVAPFKTIGAIRVLSDTLAYPIVAAVKGDDGVLLGYFVRWRKVSNNPESRNHLLGLLGSNASLYVGNAQGNLWTDLVNLVPAPPLNMHGESSMVRYSRDGKTSALALAKPVTGTPWIVLVEFPEEPLMGQASGFLRRMIFIGLFIFVVGVGSAFLLSRTITEPLQNLTDAASAISAGNYSRVVKVERSDELGALANAFNTMGRRVRESQRDLEQRIQERTEQLQNSNKELESFSYSVSHDLRAPLRAINGFSSILNDGYAQKMPQEAQRYLSMIQSNAGQMGQLVDDLLEFSRLGRKELQKQSVDPKQLVMQVLHEMQGEREGRDVSITIGELPQVHADPSLLKQVFVNLISNALKYTRIRDEARIEINSYNTNGNGNGNGGVVYFVRDNGAGFDMKYAHKLFGVFQRLHLAEDFEGTGVGLATAERIISRHGGQIWAEGETNVGATFFFTMPQTN
jgi:signal transduction histidine kinase